MKQWELFKKMVKLGRIPHALLFSGQSSEKRKIALEFIKLVNDGEIQEGHPDLYIVEPKDVPTQEIKISQIRELQAKLSLKPYSAPFKSVIIDSAHTLNREAQSAFLKLLEEPKGKTIFILITNYPDLLLPTILSRVEHFRFHSSLTPLTDSQKKLISEMLEVKKGDLAERFQYAKELSESFRDLREVLETWLRHFRTILLQNPNQPHIIKTLKNIQTIHFLLSTTNINSRLALEILMLELSQINVELHR